MLRPTLALVALLPALTATAQETIPLRHCLAIAGVARGGRLPFDRDPIQQQIVEGTWKTPTTGDSVAGRSWAPLDAGADGAFTGPALRGGYLHFTVESATERTVLLAAAGHSLVYVNGELYPGDPYGYGNFPLPIRLKAGQNSLLFVVGRGRLVANLQPLTKPVALNTGDLTLPDFVVGERKPVLGAVIIVNGDDRPRTDLLLTAKSADGTPTTTVVPTIPARSVRKVGFALAPPKGATAGTTPIALTLTNRNGRAQDTAALTLRVRRPNESRRVTFVSEIDSSVQYYALWPAQKPSNENALVLTLHGASVEAQGQIDAYSPKDWASLVAPTNRRPFGFDWEDWGRLDALEVLAHAAKTVPHDPTRLQLTGHSMGGHGTWSLGALFPGRFAAIGPSAGWISFTTYAGANIPDGTDPKTAAFRAAANQTNTLLFKENYQQEAIYVLHGDADDNVPVGQARQMRSELSSHPRLLWYEQPGAGHWWDDGDQTPGAACVDWVPMFRLFSSARLPAQPTEAALVTVNPAVSARNGFLTIEQQERSLQRSEAKLRWDPTTAQVTGTTENVAHLSLALSGVRQVTLDSQTVALPESTTTPIALERVAGQWRKAAHPLPPTEKNPQRSGPFKLAFQHRFILVYGTKGTTEENAWSYARARYDAQAFLYRGNGAPEVVSDKEYDARASKDRSVILYGNAETNGLWKSLLAKSPIQVRRGSVRIGTRDERGENLACVFVYPKPGSKTALVGVVGGTGLVGMRLTDRLPYLVSGTAYPDWFVTSPAVLSGGTSAVAAAGFFSNSWKLAE